MQPSFAVNDDQTACGWQWKDACGNIYWFDVKIEDGTIRTYSSKDGTRTWEDPIAASIHMRQLLAAAPFSQDSAPVFL